MPSLRAEPAKADAGGRKGAESYLMRRFELMLLTLNKGQKVSGLQVHQQAGERISGVGGMLKKKTSAGTAAEPLNWRIPSSAIKAASARPSRFFKRHSCAARETTAKCGLAPRPWPLAHRENASSQPGTPERAGWNGWQAHRE